MRTIQSGDATFSVRESGAGSPLVLLHGFPFNHTMWNAQVEAFTESHHVIAPDLRGHGQSTVSEGTVTMRQMADDVAALLDVLNVKQPITLCGLSMGGYVAWEFWRHHRHRLDRLILCDTRAVGDTPEVARARQMMASEVVTAGASLAANAMLPKLFAQETYQQRPDLVKHAESMMLETAPVGIAATQRGMAERIDMTSQLGEIEVPTLVLCGTADVISPPKEMRGIADMMPHATFVEIDNAGHLAPMEQPQTVNAALADFLKN